MKDLTDALAHVPTRKPADDEGLFGRIGLVFYDLNEVWEELPFVDQDDIASSVVHQREHFGKVEEFMAGHRITVMCGDSGFAISGVRPVIDHHHIFSNRAILSAKPEERRGFPREHGSDDQMQSSHVVYIEIVFLIATMRDVKSDQSTVRSGWRWRTQGAALVRPGLRRYSASSGKSDLFTEVAIPLVSGSMLSWYSTARRLKVSNPRTTDSCKGSCVSLKRPRVLASTFFVVPAAVSFV
jgi:hypothetical protein